ncbi:MAG: hypothetical protein KIS77_05030 [Saprospiraceae bacterium]|nr:hypothetical protein [Saprospiraceae bacterium]
MKNEIACLIFFIISFLACQEESPKKHIPIGSGNPANQLNIRSLMRECLCDDSLTINNILPLKTTKKELMSLLGQPTRKCAMEGNCLYGLVWDNWEEEIDSLYFYENTVFKCSKEYAFLQSIDFTTTKIQLTHPRIILDIDTKPGDIQKAFPESGKLSRGGGNVWNGFIQLATTKQDSQEKIWFLVFHDEKLKQMVLYDVPQIKITE